MAETLAIPADEQLAEKATILSIEELWLLGLLTETQLQIDGLGREMSYEEWVALGWLFGRVKRASSWWIGDWIIFGENAFPDRYSQGQEATGLDRGTLANYVWVCSRVARKRRRADLSFGHHHAVAQLEPAQQNKFLKAAAKQGWTRDELRNRIKLELNPPEPEQPSWTDDEDGSNLAAQIAEAARALVHASSDAGDGQMVCPRERVERLAALLGEDL